MKCDICYWKSLHLFLKQQKNLSGDSLSKFLMQNCWQNRICFLIKAKQLPLFHTESVEFLFNSTLSHFAAVPVFIGFLGDFAVNNNFPPLLRGMEVPVFCRWRIDFFLLLLRYKALIQSVRDEWGTQLLHLSSKCRSSKRKQQHYYAPFKYLLWFWDFH